MAFVEDLAPFFSTADFGQAVVFNGTTTVNAIFDRAFVEAGGLQVTGTRPLLTCRTSDVSAIVTGATVVVSGNTYTVAEIEPDGTGVTTLHLRV